MDEPVGSATSLTDTAVPDRVIAETTARLAERPGDDAAHEARARALLALGRIEEAERDAMAAVRLDPDEIRYRELLAEVLAAGGAHRDAAAEFARLARNDPRQVAWTVGEAAERLDGGDPAGGVDAARRAVRLDPRNPDAQLALARGLVRLGDAAGALAAAARATELRPDAAEREVLADALWLAGRPVDAFAGYRDLARELRDAGRARVTGKAREVHRSSTRGAARLVSSIPWLFGLALRRGWASVR